MELESQNNCVYQPLGSKAMDFQAAAGQDPHVCGFSGLVPFGRAHIPVLKIR